MQLDFDIRSKHFKLARQPGAPSCVVEYGLLDAGFVDAAVGTETVRVTDTDGVEWQGVLTKKLQKLVSAFDTENTRPVLRRLPGRTRASLKKGGFAPDLMPGRYRINLTKVDHLDEV